MRWRNDERGASAILVAASLIALLGFVAVGVDLGSGFNQRRQNQTAADLSATSTAVYAGSESLAVPAGLQVARDNLDNAFSNADWQTLWETCTDPDRPAGYAPLDNPWSADPSAKLDCFSVNPAADGGPQFRVRIPDQQTDTFFGRILGVDELTTNANAHARFEFLTDGDFLPFGLLYNTPLGTEQCIVQPPPGQLAPPCTGPQAGNFGSIETPAWGNRLRNTTANCNKSDQGLLSQNIAMGSDHTTLPATGSDGTPNSFPGSGGAHPGSIADNYAKKNDCSLSSGEAIATDPVPAFPLNTLDTDTGIAADPVMAGLFGAPGSADPVYADGGLARLRRTGGGASPETITVREKDGSNQANYVVDNTPLWYYLDAGNPLGGSGQACNKAAITGAADWATRRSLFQTCLTAYTAIIGTNPAPLLSASILENPRFGWAPKFHYTTWGSGSTWQPVHSFEAIYFDGFWFNCNGQGDGINTEACDNNKGMHFYPGEYDGTTILKSGNGPYGGNLRLDQVTAIVIPLEALPASVRENYPGSITGPFGIELTR